MRLAISLGTIVCVAGLVWVAFAMSASVDVPGLLLNAAAELFGIVATVLIIDNLLDVRRREEDRKRIAREVIHELDHAIWVWQGGRRAFSAPELLWLCSNIQPTDPVPPFLQNLFIRLGSKSANTVRLRGELMRRDGPFSRAFSELAKLEAIRDHDTVMDPADIRSIVLTASTDLLSFLKEDTIVPSEPDFCQRNPTEENQTTRHYGKEIL